MPEFIVRVELYGASQEDYEVLDEAMAANRFGVQVTATNGLVYKLPTGEYYTDFHSSAEIARLQAATVAAEFGEDFAILVTPIGGPLYWRNLPQYS